MSAALPTPKILNRAAMLLAGTLQTYANADAKKLFQLQWGDFFALDIPEIHAAEVTYGVITRSDEEGLEYMVAIEVPSFEGVNAPHRETIPAAQYAVFTIDGLAHIAQFWQDIYSKWMPASNYRAGKTPAFERYDQRYDPETASGPVELWIPVEPAS